jgi:hypothetical protein
MRQDYIERLRKFPADFEALVRPLTDAQLDKCIPGEWTIRQIVHHVPDSHMNAVFRFKRPLTEDNPPLNTYDQDAIAVFADYQMPIDASLQILHGLHQRFVALLEALTDEQWQRTGVHPEWGQVTFEEIVRRYAEHGEIHIDQIKRTLAY